MLSLLFSLLAIYRCVAETIVVDTNATSSTCLLGAIPYVCYNNISSAVIHAGYKDTITLIPGYYTGDANYNICVPNLSDGSNPCGNFSKRLILTGMGDPADIIISGPGDLLSARAIYNYQSMFVSISNMTIQNFMHNITTDGIIDVDGMGVGGAAIYIDDYIENEYLNISYMIFENNHASLGGALMVLSRSPGEFRYSENTLTVVLENSRFIRNSATINGGAVAFYRSSAILKSCNFTENNVTGRAASFDTKSSGSLKVAASVGGAIYFDGGFLQTLHSENSIYEGNTAESGGGAIYLQSSSSAARSNGSFISFGDVFLGNFVGGGANCISSVSCNPRGGALYLNSLGFTIDNSLFDSNYASTESSNYLAQGGAIYTTNSAGSNVVKTSIASITGSFFTRNYAMGAGGAVYSSDQLLYVENTDFVANAVNLTNNYFTDSASQGGAIYLTPSMTKSGILGCNFVGNKAHGGWGGAIFGVSAQVSSAPMSIVSSSFSNNQAFSSYTNAALGGAIMISSDFSLSLNDVKFLNNSASPVLDANPLTYSGTGGALFVQTAVISINSSEFSNNYAFTGQFDSGAGGGAIALEDSYPVDITHTNFLYNGAVGYVGYSTFAMPGAGGAIYVKFSSATIEDCEFGNNWASAAGFQNSIGGAIAVFFDITDVYDMGSAVYVSRSRFRNNSAFGEMDEVCRGTPDTAESGEGGAIAIIGAGSGDPVILRDLQIEFNIAFSSESSNFISFGGGLSVSYASSVIIRNCTFKYNLALAGVGDDIAGISGEIAGENSINVSFSNFTTPPDSIFGSIVSTAVANQELYCNSVSKYFPSSSSWNRRLHVVPINKAEEHMSRVSMKHDVEEAFLAETGRQMHDMRRTRPQSRALSNAPYFIGHDSNGVPFQRQLLSPVPIVIGNASDSLVSFHPGIVITSGKSHFRSSSFNGPYHIFFGDYRLPPNQNVNTDGGSRVSTVSIVGDLSSDGLIITVVKSAMELSPNSNTKLFQLNIINSSLAFNRDVIVTNDSFISEAAMTATDNNFRPSNAQLTFLGTLFTGLTIGRFVSADISVFGDVNNNYSASVFHLEGCQLVIKGRMVLSAPSQTALTAGTKLSATTSIVFFGLSSRANFTVAKGGVMFMLADTKFQLKRYSVVENHGSIYLLGRTAQVIDRLIESTPLSSQFTPDSYSANQGSLLSTLDISGTFTQLDSAEMHIILNHTSQSSPVVFLESSNGFNGKVYVDFYTQQNFTDSPNLLLYSPSIPSAWDLFAFEYPPAHSSALNISLIGPIGLAFRGKLKDDTETIVGNFTTTAVEQYELTAIGCDLIKTYYDLTPGRGTDAYACYICLMNSSCSLCENQVCAINGECPDDESALYTNNCCGSDCNSPYGHCHANSDHTRYYCKCTTIFWGGTNCKSITSTLLAIIISVSAFVVIVLLTFFFYMRSLKQKKQVLDDLRDGLLRNTESGFSGNKEYIQAMQQALILNDVFVKWEEIKLEQVVGEGSFGVVHKATFRGAQVAVKQMRSLFVELTEKDIDEFRREAYVMSRLRHPNIVLVMGISLVDQEPIPLPKSKSKFQTVDDSARRTSTDRDGGVKGGGKPQQTVCIITEFLEQGSLADILYGPTRLPPEIWTYELVLTCALQAARGMLYLHSHQPPICHRDLKSSNLVVDDHWVVKVTDFGMSRIVPEQVMDLDKLGSEGVERRDRDTMGGGEGLGRDSIGSDPHGTSESGSIAVRTLGSSSSVTGSSQNKSALQSSEASAPVGLERNLNPFMTSNLGTTAWAAPELLTSGTQTRYSIKVDVYSFGMVLWELWEKKRPFDEFTSRFDIMDAVRAGKRPIISETCPPTYRSLIQRCWQTDPARRPMFKYIVRYLKDELARVKRQKNGNPSTSSSNSLGFSFSPFGMEHMNAAIAGSKLGGTAEDERSSIAIDDEQSFIRRSFAAAANTLGWIKTSSNADTMPGPEIRNSTASIGDRGSLGGGVRLSSVDNSNSSMRSSSVGISSGTAIAAAGDEGAAATPPERTSLSRVPNLPEGRSPLVNAVKDRNLSYLSESPAVSQFMLLQHQRAAAPPPPSFTAKTNQNSWRDRYVMKFSGWNSNNPDTGLPPSLSTSGVASSPSVSQTSSTVHASSGAVVPKLTGSIAGGASTTTSSKAIVVSKAADETLSPLISNAVLIPSEPPITPHTAARIAAATPYSPPSNRSRTKSGEQHQQLDDGAIFAMDSDDDK